MNVRGCHYCAQVPTDYELTKAYFSSWDEIIPKLWFRGVIHSSWDYGTAVERETMVSPSTPLASTGTQLPSETVATETTEALGVKKP